MTTDTLTEVNGELETVTEKITPDLARQYMATNIDNNRKIRDDFIAAYARDMVEGRWLLTGQGIEFDTNNRMINGQHRMLAIIASGLPVVEMRVTRGVHPDALLVIDSGIKRTGADYLGIHEVPNRIVVAAIARLVLLCDSKEIANMSHRKVTNAELLGYTQDHLGELAHSAERAVHYKNDIPSTASVIGCAYTLFYRSDKGACNEFFTAIAEMQLTGTGDPRLTLVRRLNNVKASGARTTQLYHLDLWIRAWNAWRKGEALVLPQFGKPIAIQEVG